MKAVLMAGGFGTRLRPLTINLPKPMVPVGNLPIMEHVVSLLAKHGITDIISLLYFQPEIIRDYFEDGSRFGVNMTYVQPDEDYGTAGAVRHAIGDSDEPVLVMSGDVICDFDLTEAIAWHNEKRSEATILLTHVENPLQYGIVITSPDGRIVRFLEKPSWGEAFSDTINTGIYILEANAVRLIPPKTNYDFSQNLYPLMLSKKMGLHGKVSDGYWKDVGNVKEYQNAHADLLSGKLDLDLKTEMREIDGARVYTGQNVEIDSAVRFEGTVVLGDGVRLEPGVKVISSAIGTGTRVGRGSQISNSVVWSRNSIGHESSIDNAIVCGNCRLGQNVRLHDNVIVSDNCFIGDSATVKANCKIWPDKVVDAGAIVSSSMVWGDKWNRELFTDSKITGLALTEITPEMAVRLGTALGATLGQGASVVTSRDASDISRLLRRGLLSGMLAAGVNVSDLETTPIPIVRYELRKGSYTAGIYVRHNPFDYREIDFILLDGNGLDMPNSKLKKIERNYFGEDYERATLDKIGHLERPQRVLVNYRQDFMSEIDIGLIKKAGFKIVIDYSNGAASAIFPTLFSRLGIRATELNAYLDPRKFSTSPEEQSQSIVQLSAIVSSLKTDI
ncbi:MAG: sugar phosphate nucleotidyltransferase, partial [Candidatus Zixiibacteriota bacterium]